MRINSLLAAAVMALAATAGCSGVTKSVSGAFASVGSGFKKGISAISPKEKVVPANDPISLAHKSPPPGPDLYVSMAEMREKSGDYEGAVNQYQKALKLDPKHFGALIGMAHLYDRQEKYSEATTWYQRANQQHPENATGWNDLGLCLARQGKMNEALAALQRAIDLAPDRKLYHNNAATVLVELGRPEEAFAHLARAHGAAAGHYNLGYLLQQRGHSAPAAEQFRQALALDPSITQAAEMLAQIEGPARPQVAAHPESTPELRVADARGNTIPVVAPQPVRTAPLRTREVQVNAQQFGMQQPGAMQVTAPSPQTVGGQPPYDPNRYQPAESWERPIQLPQLDPSRSSPEADSPPLPTAYPQQ